MDERNIEVVWFVTRRNKWSAMSRYRGAGPMSMLTDGAALLGRLLLALIFLLSGFQKLAGFEGTVAFMAAEGLPFPLLAAIVALIVECLGGVALVIGYQTPLVGLVMAVWCIATALVAHSDFSNQDQMINFLKNVAMAGGFLQLVAFGAGGWSLDARRGSAVL
jgi:putative oxidoreductase